MFRLHTFGELELYDDGNEIVALPTRKVGYLLAYLWCHRGNSQSRERLAGLFWPESNIAKARHSLTQALAPLRKILSAENKLQEPVLELSHTSVCLKSSESFWVDAEILENAIDSLHRDPLKLTNDIMKEVVNIYRGPFLDGCYDDWCLEERDRFQDEYLNLMRFMAGQCLNQEQLKQAESILKKILRALPWDEHSHRTLMQIYHRSGRKNDAIKQYELCASVLEKEFGLKPDHETTEFLDWVRATPTSDRHKPTNSELNPAQPEIQKQKSSIAVLPFVDLSSGKDQAYFSDGLSEELIGALTRVRALRVISRSSSFALKGKQLNLREIGQTLEVDTVLEGSVRLAGDHIRITARLNQVITDDLLWTETYDRTIDDIFLLQDEITGAIVNSLKIKLFGRADRGLSRPASYQAAYHHYLRGKYYWNLRTESDLHKALEFFTLASEEDANYAPAISGLADAYSVLGYYHYLPRDVAFEKAKEAAEYALNLDETLAEAHLSLGLISDYLYQWKTAHASYRRAMQLNPGSASAYHWYALFKMNQNQIDEAQKSIERAHALDPFSVAINRDFGQILYYSRRYEEAKTYLQNAIEMNPHLPLSHLYLGFVHIQGEEHSDAKRVFEKERSIAGNRDMTPEIMLIYLFVANGDVEKAKIFLSELNAQGEKRYISQYYVALLHFAVGHYQEGIEGLKQAFATHDLSMSRINVDPLLNPYREDNELVALLQEHGFCPPT